MADAAKRRTTLVITATVVAVALAITGVLVLGGGSDDGDQGDSAARERQRDAAEWQLIGGGGGQSSENPEATGTVGGGSREESGSGTGTGGGASTGGTQPPKGELVKPAHSSGTDGTTVVIGQPAATATLELYEDLRCPPCAQFEQNVGATIIKDIKDGKYKARFTLATFLDNTMGGSGSRNALSALGAALDVSPEAFLDYKKALYAQGNHPTEGADTFSSDTYLLKIAEQVPALAANSAFQGHVRTGTFDVWAYRMSRSFDTSGVASTPTVKLDGQLLSGGGGVGPPTTVADFTRAVDARL
ncbi:thioredoxin domain-containing protein [Streptomyces sp. NPDC057702]|uniref:thioredoxin domain-containing protein n=1 Tax=unclassified Streptomyces TaxID=2593676 RepID=UPI00369BEF88